MKVNRLRYAIKDQYQKRLTTLLLPNRHETPFRGPAKSSKDEYAAHNNTYDHLWLRCAAFDADRKRLDLGESIDELTRFPMRAQALLWIILRRLR